MARTRSFYPPALCDKCQQPPILGVALFPARGIWLCQSCLADETPGDDITSKAARRSLRAEEERSFSRREKAAGRIESVNDASLQARRHSHAADSIKNLGLQKVQGAFIASGEAASVEGYLKDTLADPDLAAIESSEMRGRLLLDNGIVSLGIDSSNTIGAANTIEKMQVHQLALAHKIALEQAAKARYENDPKIEMRRLQTSARMMDTFQQGVFALHKLRTGGTQNVVVQHVHVADGGQAVIGAVQTGRNNEDAHQD
jgi:hypothetical protein